MAAGPPTEGACIDGELACRCHPPRQASPGRGPTPCARAGRVGLGRAGRAATRHHGSGRRSVPGGRRGCGHPGRRDRPGRLRHPGRRPRGRGRPRPGPGPSCVGCRRCEPGCGVRRRRCGVRVDQAGSRRHRDDGAQPRRPRPGGPRRRRGADPAREADRHVVRRLGSVRPRVRRPRLAARRELRAPLAPRPPGRPRHHPGGADRSAAHPHGAGRRRRAGDAGLALRRPVPHVHRVGGDRGGGPAATDGRGQRPRRRLRGPHREPPPALRERRAPPSTSSTTSPPGTS